MNAETRIICINLGIVTKEGVFYERKNEGERNNTYCVGCDDNSFVDFGTALVLVC